jgi:hypothetical protein
MSAVDFFTNCLDFAGLSGVLIFLRVRGCGAASPRLLHLANQLINNGMQSNA